MAIHRGDTLAGVDHEQAEIRIIDGDFGLAAHAVFQRSGLGPVKACGIQQREAAAAEGRIAFAPVAGYPRLVIDKRELAPDQAIEQRGFADIRAADDHNSGGHSFSIAYRSAIRSALSERR